MGTAILTGVFGLVGVLIGGGLNVYLESRRQTAERERAKAQEAAARARDKVLDDRALRTVARLLHAELSKSRSGLKAARRIKRWWREESLSDAKWQEHQATVARFVPTETWLTIEMGYGAIEHLQYLRAAEVGDGPRARMDDEMAAEVDDEMMAMTEAIDALKRYAWMDDEGAS